MDNTDTFVVPDTKVQERINATRRARAQKLLDASSETGGQMVGGWYVGKNPLQSGLEGALGAYENRTLDDTERQQARELADIRSELLRRMSPAQQQEAQAKAAGLNFTPEKPAEGFTLGEGQQRFGPKGEPLASGPPRPVKDDSPQSVKEYNFAQSQGYKGDYSTWLKDKTQATTRVHVAAPQRDRFQVVPDASGVMHRVNLDTGEATPVTTGDGTLKKALPAAKPLPAKAQEQQSSLLNLDSSLKNYMGMLDKYDVQGGSTVSPTDRAALASSFTDMQMRLKDAYTLGAITGPDMAILQNALRDPTSVGGTLRGAAFGKGQFKEQAGQVRGTLDRMAQNFEKQWKQPAGIGSAAPKQYRLKPGANPDLKSSYEEY